MMNVGRLQGFDVRNHIIIIESTFFTSCFLINKNFIKHLIFPFPPCSSPSPGEDRGSGSSFAAGHVHGV